MALYAGLMSGTSLDGIDAALVDFELGAEGLRIALKSHRHRPFEPALRSELLALNAAGTNELHRMELAATALARGYAGLVADLLADAKIGTQQVRAIGAHGQTVRHRPGEFDGIGYTTQLLNGALLAEMSAIDVVCDFRRRDIAAGGQGAPLAPALHASLFAAERESRAVLNLGGIANLTLLRPGRAPVGFDCGPASCMLDAWCLGHRSQAFDDEGRWASQGTVIEPLLAALLAEPYFALPPPKSTGRDRFNMHWLQRHLGQSAPDAAPIDVQATLAALTVRSIAADMARFSPDASLLMVCGGGARNTHLMRGLAAALPSTRVTTTASFGLPVDQVEAVAFAWLAQRFIEREPGNIASVTGARGARILGALYPA